MLHQLLAFIHQLTNPDSLKAFLVDWRAFAVLFAVVFAESGLLVGFFLPGDSLLFTVGVVAGAGRVHVLPMIGILAAASILGDGSGFLIGGTLGYSLFKNEKSKIFRREYLERTHAFYERHGGKTIIYAKFVPIIRTFAAFVAGVGKMSYRRFLVFNVCGALGWVSLMIVSGYLLGNNAVVRNNFEFVILGIIAVSLIPVGLQILKSRKQASKVEATAAN